MKYVLPVLAVVVAAAGCMNERTYMDPAQNASFGGGAAQSNVSLTEGRIKGDFGPRHGFDGTATEMQGTSDPQWRTSTVTVARTEQTRGTGMVILWTNGVTLDTLDVGAHDYTFDENSIDTPPVSMNVCSGGDSSSIDFDRPVDHVTATVQQTPQGRTVQLHTSTAVLDAAGNPDLSAAPQTSDTTFTVASGSQS